MKQTPAAIIVLAGAIFAFGAAVCYGYEFDQMGLWVGVSSVVSISLGVIFLIRACLLDHEMAVDVRGRLDFLEELVYLERISLEQRQRRLELRGEIPSERSSLERSGRDRVTIPIDRYSSRVA